MNRWGRRIRAAIAMGLIWAVAWGGIGGPLARLSGSNSDLPPGLLFAALGFITGTLFSVMLVAIERRRGIDRTSVPRFAAWGAASGLLLSAIFTAAAGLRGASMLSEFLLFGPALTIASAACAAGTLAVARRAATRALPNA